MYRRIILTAAGLVLATSNLLSAVGLDRSGASPFNTDFMYGAGNAVTVTIKSHDSSITGTSILGTPITNSLDDFVQRNLTIKNDINDQISIGLAYDEPRGASVSFQGGGGFLSTVSAENTWKEVLGLVKYQVNENISVIGGLRMTSTEGGASLSVPVPDVGFVPYNYQTESDTAWGTIIGAAYEIKEIGLRVSATVHGETDITQSTTETSGLFVPTVGTTVLPSTENTTGPRTVMLKAQSAVTEEIFVGTNWTKAYYDPFSVSPIGYLGVAGSALYDPGTDTATDYYGAYKVSDNVRLLYAYSTQEKGDTNIVSYFEPFDGTESHTFGVLYTGLENADISVYMTNTAYGDARIVDMEDGNPASYATMTNNEANRIGVSLTYKY